MGIIRTYRELKTLRTFDERFEYLRLNGKVSDLTFGFDRYLNQMFYKSGVWLKVRDDIIVRDLGCDLAIPDYEILNGIYVHHMNPISKDDILNDTEFLFNPDFLITTCLRTHNAIHYGSRSPNILIERCSGDTCPWKFNRR